MAGLYRPRHPERTVLYRVLFHYFDRFLAEYEGRFEKESGFLRPVIKEVVERYLDCGNPRCGFARIRCPDCHAERLLMFSCRTRGFCPSCHSKRLEEWGEWMRETLLLDVPHRQVVFTIPRMLRIFFKYNRRLLGELCRCGLRSLTRYFQVTTGSELMPGVIAAIQTFGARINAHPHLHFLVTEGGVDEGGVFQKVSRIDDSRLAELFGREVLGFLVSKELLSPEWADRLLSWRHTGFNVHSRVRARTNLVPVALGLIEEELRPLPSKGWAEMIRKVDEVDPMLCPKCGGLMRVIAFLTDYAVVDRIIDHLNLTFVAERPPPAHSAYPEVLMVADTPAEYLS
ncbi:transposase [bacterium]|nr:MAG: transposase [bacterium]